MYESRDYVMMEMLFASASFSDFLNRNDYIEQISAYDRRKLEEYRAVKEQVIEKEARLAAEKKELDEYKAQVEEEKSRVSYEEN